MKLIQKVNRQYTWYAFAILCLAGLSLYFIIKTIVKEETDEKLLNTSHQMEQLISSRPGEFELYPLFSVKQTTLDKTGKNFTDTSLVINDEEEDFRQLEVYTKINGQNYIITVRESGIESEDLMLSLLIVVLACFVLLLVLLFIINRKISQNIWKPFFINLEKLRTFSLQSGVAFSPKQTDIEEFIEMNDVLKMLTGKVMADYDNLKKFSENAAHELQTPLAIIRSKVESLIEENNLSPIQIDKIRAIYKTANRLTKINKGLLLLTKIENKQFPDTQLISLDEMIRDQFESFGELLEMKEVNLKYICHEDMMFEGNKTLMELLLNNLFANAILHNFQGGHCIIRLSKQQFSIANPGEAPIADSNRLFERFYKGSKSESTGLGLAISKQICLNFGWEISYQFEDRMHIFSISF